MHIDCMFGAIIGMLIAFAAGFRLGNAPETRRR